MNKLVLPLFLSIVFFSCGSDDIAPIEEVDPNHFSLEEIYDYLPLEQFSMYSQAVFINSINEEIRFNLTIDEEALDIIDNGEMYSFSRITFTYSPENPSIILPINVFAHFRDLPNRGFTAVIDCLIVNFLSSIFSNSLEIVPGEDYKNTILNEEFQWMDRSFPNTYSNILVEENPLTNIKLFYQVGIGIIGINDGIGNTYVFDRFE